MDVASGPLFRTVTVNVTGLPTKTVEDDASFDTCKFARAGHVSVVSITGKLVLLLETGSRVEVLTLAVLWMVRGAEQEAT